MIKGIKHISFDLPPGIDDGDYAVRGEGESIPDGENGDLIVRVRVSPHPKFKRDGSDLFYDLNISMFDAALGNEIDVPTLEKSEKIKIEEGSQPNTILKLKGKGLPHLNSRGKGDQFVRLIVNIPKKLSKQQKGILKEFQDKI
jgi:molecular chaperone DnaJ